MPITSRHTSHQQPRVVVPAHKLAPDEASDPIRGGRFYNPLPSIRNVSARVRPYSQGSNRECHPVYFQAQARCCAGYDPVSFLTGIPLNAIPPFRRGLIERTELSRRLSPNGFF